MDFVERTVILGETIDGVFENTTHSCNNNIKILKKICYQQAYYSNRRESFLHLL